MNEKGTVVVVDDEEEMVSTLRDILQISGYRVEVAVSGPEAVALCADVAPSWVLIDILMPGMDGVEASREIRRQTPQAKIVYMTANVATQRAQEAGRQCEAVVLSKPLDLPHLLHMLESGPGA